MANYKELSAGEGWGVVYMFGIAGFAVVVLVIDFIFQLFKQKNNEHKKSD